MAEIDDELMARVLQWCAEAGRPASPPEVREALAPLTWDELLAVRALLADAPPARPLGPAALVDLARGASPEVAAERERARHEAAPGAARADATAAAGEAPPAAAAPPETKKTRGKASRRVATVVIRRARDRHDAPAPGEPQLPLLDELFLPEGRAILQRWVRRHGARRARLVEELAAFRRPDGSAPDADDAARLLDAHGMTRPFERREREELLHALRAAAGTLSGAARALAISSDDLRAAVERLGIEADVERVRDDRREDIRRRATLGDRVRLLVDDADRLEDLGMTAEIEADVRSRLGEHMKALRAGSTHHVAPSFARTLGITRDQASAVAARFGLDLRDSAPRAEPAGYDAAARPYRARHGRGRHDATARGDSRSRGAGGFGGTAGAPRGGGQRGGAAPRSIRGGAPATGGSRPRGGGARPMSGARPQGTGSRPPSGGSRPTGGGARPMMSEGRARPFGGAARTPGGGFRPMAGGERRPQGAPQRGHGGQVARAGAAGARPAPRGPRVGDGRPSRGPSRGGANPRGESPRPRKPPRR